jgi:type 1 glutamine amidotransferase
MRLSRLLLCAVALTAAPALLRAEDKPVAGKTKVLLVTHSGGFIHSSVVEAEKVLKALGDKNGFEVVCWRFTNDPDQKVKYKVKVDGKDVDMEGTALEQYSARFKGATKEGVSRDQVGRINADTLKPFDAVFFFTTGDPVVNDKELDALLDFVKSGKGFLGTHCATDTMYKYTKYGDMIGAYFDGHPLGGKTKVLVEDTKHPITQGLGESFEISDELYQFRTPYSRDQLHVLMRLDPLWVEQRKADEKKRMAEDKKKKEDQLAKLKDDGKGDSADAKKLEAELKDWDKKKLSIKREDNDYAMAWVRTYGKGRVFYTALGHGENVWRDPRFQNMIVQAIKWSTGQVDGNAAPSGGKK